MVNILVLNYTYRIYYLCLGLGRFKGVLNNFTHFGSARLFLFSFAYYIKQLLIYDIW